MHNLSVNGVTSGSCHIGHDHTLLADQTVHNRRLAYIRLAYDGYTWALILFFLTCMLWKMCNHFIQKISQTKS